MSKIMIFLALVGLMLVNVSSKTRNLQFSHHIDGYLPSQFPREYSLFIDQTGNVIDPYIVLGPFNTVVGYGSTGRGVRFKAECLEPLTFVNGACQCANGGRLLEINGKQVCAGRNGFFQVQKPKCPIQQTRKGSVPEDSLAGLFSLFRTYDGSNNNENFPDWGLSDTPLIRLTNSYTQKIKQPQDFLPTPRLISNRIGSFAPNQIPNNRLGLSIAFTIFGQFLDHDIDLTQAQHPDTMDNIEWMNITIPDEDPFYQNQEYIQFTRSQFMPVEGVRTFPNMITTWVDGSQVYGSSAAISCMLREFKNGKLKTSEGNLLPKFQNFFRAGDIRAIENVILTSYHTIFLREHNRICDELLLQHPDMNDQELFQAARNYVIGLLQKIVYKQFLPILLGDKYEEQIGDYNGYNPTANPTLPLEFSTSAFRVGHALLTSRFKRINKDGEQIGEYRLTQLFFAQHLVNNQTIDELMRGIPYTPMKEKSPRIIDQIRNLLIPDFSKQDKKIDLFSLNLQRGRDHGISGYNFVREAYGLPTVRTFSEILPFDAQSLILSLQFQRLYTSPDYLQLWLGITAEKPVNNGVLGELGVKIVGQAFRNIRDGDRFWYQHAYPQNIIDQIDSTTLSDIIRRNTGAQNIPDNFFYLDL